MFPALVSPAGKHRHVQRRILSFLTPYHRRVARTVFRECPPPEGQLSMSQVATELASSPATYPLLRYEVEERGMATESAIEKLFASDAPAEVIAWAVLQHDNACCWTYKICQKQRTDVFELLNSHHYIWDEGSLCSSAWNFDRVEIIQWLIRVRQKSATFIWSRQGPREIGFPYKIYLALCGARFFPESTLLASVFEHIVDFVAVHGYFFDEPALYRRLETLFNSVTDELEWTEKPFQKPMALRLLSDGSKQESRHGHLCAFILEWLEYHGVECKNE